jgi:hypothetical protein
MNRVITLSNKLQQQLAMQSPIDEMLVTVSMLQSELLHEKKMNPAKGEDSAVSVVVAPAEKRGFRVAEQEMPIVEEKIVEMLIVDEAEIEAELEEIRRNALEKNSVGGMNRPSVSYESPDETNIEAHVAPVSDKKPAAAEVSPPPAALAVMHMEPAAAEVEKKPVAQVVVTMEPAAAEVKKLPVAQVVVPKEPAASINDSLKQSKNEIGDFLLDSPIKDLKKAIGINDRFLFINELFMGDEVLFERSVKTINNFSIYEEADYWIQRELKIKMAWDSKGEVAKQFNQLVRRRFLSM